MILNNFENSFNKNASRNNENHDFSHLIAIPYLGSVSTLFAKRLRRLVYKKYNIHISTYLTTKKVGSYFPLKCQTPVFLQSNVVYKFTCLRDASLTYIGMSSRHFTTRIQEHFKVKNMKSAVNDHLQKCLYCSSANRDSLFSSFSIIKKCKSKYDTKIQEALIIKKENPVLNKQLYENGVSFLLNVY